MDSDRAAAHARLHMVTALLIATMAVVVLGEVVAAWFQGRS